MESQWNVGIKKIKTKYPELNLYTYELSEDLRFFNERSLYSPSWYFNDFNYLKQIPNSESDRSEVKTEISFFFDTETLGGEFYLHYLPWEFWQIIGYPVSVSIVVECLSQDVDSIKKIIKRLPAGQIFTFKKDTKSKRSTLLAIVQLKNNIDRFFENIVPILNNLSCKYSISLIIPLTLYGDKFIAK
ncbi:hypothetical protein ES708_21501 [subsurface metagenome]